MEKLPSYYYRIDNPELLAKIDAFFERVRAFDAQVNTLDEMLLNQGEALAQAKAQAVPEGFVLVPKEPTDIEIESIKEKHWDMRGCQLCKSDYIDLYKAMIEAQEQHHD